MPQSLHWWTVRFHIGKRWSQDEDYLSFRCQWAKSRLHYRYLWSLTTRDWFMYLSICRLTLTCPQDSDEYNIIRTHWIPREVLWDFNKDTFLMLFLQNKKKKKYMITWLVSMILNRHFGEFFVSLHSSFRSHIFLIFKFIFLF